MIDEMRSRFGPRFLDTARGRIRRSLQLLGKPDEAPGLVTELHSLAGEASMLGLSKMSDTARRGEQYAKEWDRGSTTAKLYCARSVRALSQQIEEFAGSMNSPAVAPGGTPAAAAGEQPAVASGSRPVAVANPPARVAGKPAVTVPAPLCRSASQSEASHAAARVLIIDDSRLAGDHLCEALGEVAIAARLATTHDAAIAELVGFTPRLVVCDVHMPGVDLVELCAALRDKAPRRVAIILISGMSEPELARHAREVEADGFISKHAGIDEVVEHVRSALEELAR